MTEEFKVGDRVVWETEKRVGKDIKVEPFSGNVTQVGKGWVVVNYAPGKQRQVTIGTLGLRKAAKQQPAEPAEKGDTLYTAAVEAEVTA